MSGSGGGSVDYYKRMREKYVREELDKRDAKIEKTVSELSQEIEELKKIIKKTEMTKDKV